MLEDFVRLTIEVKVLNISKVQIFIGDHQIREDRQAHRQTDIQTYGPTSALSVRYPGRHLNSESDRKAGIQLKYVILLTYNTVR